MIGKKSSSETVLVTHETNIKDFISICLNMFQYVNRKVYNCLYILYGSEINIPLA
jgi:hypothetical protein